MDRCRETRLSSSPQPRRIFVLKKLIAVFAALCAFTAAAPHAQAQFFDGTDYRRIAGAPSSVPGKIEVLEFFCYYDTTTAEIEKAVVAWRSKLPGDVVFKRVPCLGQGVQDDLLARGHYTIEALGLGDAVVSDVIYAYQLKHLPLETPDQWADYLSSFGKSRASVQSVFDGFGVTSSMKRAATLAEKDQVTGTAATFVVDGHYLTSIAMLRAPDQPSQVLSIVDFLVGQVRAERGATAPASPCKRRCRSTLPSPAR